MHLPTIKPRRPPQLAILNEQAAIARQLGIADNQAGLAALGIDISIENERPRHRAVTPYYLRGFKALRAGNCAH